METALIFILAKKLLSDTNIKKYCYSVAVIESYKVRGVDTCSVIDKFDWNLSVRNAHQSMLVLYSL